MLLHKHARVTQGSSSPRISILLGLAAVHSVGCSLGSNPCPAGTEPRRDQDRCIPADERDAENVPTAPADEDSGQPFDGGVDAERDASPSVDAQIPELPEQLEPGEHLLELALGSGHSCVRTSHGRVFCWGWGDWGQLGDGKLDHGERCDPPHTLPSDCTSRPVLVRELPSSSQLAAADTVTCALHAPRGKHVVSCWGQLHSEAPQPLLYESRPIEDAVEVRVGGGHACVRRSGALPVCGGDNHKGELGLGDDLHAEVLIEASTLSTLASPAQLVRLSLGDSHSCALLTTGKILCWGGNGVGQCGQPAKQSAVLMPAFVPNVANVATLAAGGDETCFVVDGKAYCLGADSRGQLGNGTVIDAECVPGTSCSVEPTEVQSDATARVEQLAVGAEFSCLRRSDGRVFCSGSNERGQLGPSVSASSSETPVLVLEHAVDMAAGSQHACAIVEGDQILCWGSNDFAQLGIPTAERLQSSEPILVGL